MAGSRRGRLLTMLVACATAAVLLAPQAAGQTELLEPIPAPQHDPFYTPPDPVPDVAAGTVLRSRPVTVRALAVPVQVDSWQMLYRSTDTQGEPEAVSGTVLVPDTPWTGGPRPLVTYAVGSHGLGPECAPSYQMRQGQDPELGLISLALSQGWAVVVTDYEGSGTPGPHTYAAGRTTGQAVLDAARAAQRLPQARLDPAGLVGVWGYSEGGIGAGWAGELAPTYAPQLRIAGIASGGTPADLEPVVRHLDGGPFSGLALAGAVGLATAYPDLRFRSILTPEGEAAVERISTQCVDEFTRDFAFRRLADLTTVDDPVALPQWQRVLDANRLGTTPPAAPVLLYHAALDELIPVTVARQLAADYCARDVTVRYLESPIDEHVSYAANAAPAAVTWLAERFAGQPASSTC
ncbi:MAG: lipase [Pseudonocardiaceae bacterium]|nr:lipase [Pseudonocardiaceae bacterium]